MSYETDKIIAKKRRDNHLCVRCGDRAAASNRKGHGGFSYYCEKHLVLKREDARKRNSYKKRNLTSGSYDIDRRRIWEETGI